MFSHRFHRSAQMLGCVGSPTESTDLTELLAECILPQISQNSQNFLLRLFSHRFQIYTEVRLSSRGCTCLRSALPLARARSAPTEQEDGLTEFIAATFFNNGFNGLIGFDGCVSGCVELTTDLTDSMGVFQGVHLSQVHQPSNVDIPLATLVHFLLWQAAKPSGDKCTP